MRVGRCIMGAFYVTAGIGHFVAVHLYERMMPDSLPAHRELVLISGVAEIAGGLGVLLPQTRRAASWGIVLLLVAVFPAHLAMVRHSERWPSIPLWAMWLRMPLQLPLIYWAWLYTRDQSDARLAD